MARKFECVFDLDDFDNAGLHSMDTLNYVRLCYDIIKGEGNYERLSRTK